MSVRKAHNSGRNHIRNVVEYYQQVGHEKAQTVIDTITSSYAAAGQEIGNPILQMAAMNGGHMPPPLPMPGMPGFPMGGPGMPPLPFPPMPGMGMGRKYSHVYL